MLRNRLRRWTALEFLEAFLYAAAIGLVIRMLILTPYRVEDNLMAPAILAGDYIFSYDLAFGVPNPFSSKRIGSRIPRRGEIVIFQAYEDGSGEELKRVWGIPGDRLEVKDNILFINGNRVDFKPGQVKNYGPIVVIPGQVFVAADTATVINAAHGNGMVKNNRVIGRAWKIWFSVAWESTNQDMWSSIRWNRIFHTVH